MFKKQRPRTWRVNGWKGSCSSSVFLSFDCNLEEELSHRGAWVEGGRLWLWSACHYQDLSLSVFPRSLCLTLLPSTLCLAPPVCGCSATAARRCQNISGRATRHTHTHTHTVFCALHLYIECYAKRRVGRASGCSFAGKSDGLWLNNSESTTPRIYTHIPAVRVLSRSLTCQRAHAFYSPMYSIKTGSFSTHPPPPPPPPPLIWQSLCNLGLKRLFFKMPWAPGSWYFPLNYRVALSP